MTIDFNSNSWQAVHTDTIASSKQDAQEERYLNKLIKVWLEQVDFPVAVIFSFIHSFLFPHNNNNRWARNKLHKALSNS